MKFEDLQNQWQKEDGDTAIQVSYDILLREVSRNQRSFDREILWRDIRECIASLIGVCFLILFGVALNKWFYAAAGGMLYVAIFFIVYRRFRPKKSPVGTASLRTCIEESLDEINCQIHLLKNVFWWYLLAPGITFIFPLVKIGGFLNHKERNIEDMLVVIFVAVFLGLVFWWVCWLNRRCIRKDLLPRKQELEDLLRSIGNGQEKGLKANIVNLWIAFFLSVLITLFLSTPLFFVDKTSWVEEWQRDLSQQVKVEITPPLSPEEAVGPKELKILSARYGAKDQWVDVTGKVVDAVHENTLSIHSGNELAGRDPLDGHTKTLEVECLWDGQKKTIRVREGTDLKIPFETAPNTVPTDKLSNT